MHLILDEPSLLEAEQYLDHELRIGEVFRRRGLSDVAIQRHIKALMMANKKVRLLGNSSPPPDYVLEATTTDKITRVLLAYGDISDENLLRNSKQNDNLRAIVSPEDTCLSVGGGAALSIAHKAGLRRILHDLYKFAPISQGSTAVTSAGRLDVQYLIHAASVDVSESGASTNDAIVKKTTEDILRRVASLGVNIVWIPLLGAGVAGITSRLSLEAIIDAINNLLKEDLPCTVVITVFNETLLPRQEVEIVLKARLTNKPIKIDYLY